jgi:hypothetical protein
MFRVAEEIDKKKPEEEFRGGQMWRKKGAPAAEYEKTPAQG